MFNRISLINTILISFLLFILVACGQEESNEKIYLENAKNSAIEKDWTSVIREIQKFISIEDKASLKEKEEAWFLLSEATLYLGKMMQGIEILELMLEDAEYDSEARVRIYKRLIHLYDRVKNFEKAAYLRVKLINYEEMDDNTAALLFLEAGLNYQSAGRYKESDEILNFALKRVKDSALKAKIYYYKAYAKTIYDEMELAEFYLEEALKNTVIDKEVEGQIYYLIGDIYEMQKKYSEAYRSYEKALGLYPNKLFVQKKLDFIKKNYSSFLEDDIKK